MRNLKRALSLALATVMVLSMMVVGAGAASLNDFSDGEKVVNKEAVTVLTTLNVINGKDDGTYDPEGIVTRAEMAKMICVILNGGRDPQLGESLKNSYTDTVGHWAAGYIEYCTTMGIVSGRGNGTFDPSGTVSVAEAGKMVLVALGYNAGVEGYTGANWQINVDAQANPMGLYDGLGTLNTNVDLTRDNAARMLYNALDKNMVTYDYVITGTADNSISTKPQINDKDKGTLLEEKFNAVKVEGIVVGNETADMTSKKTNEDYATKGEVIGNALDKGKTRVLITNGGANQDQTVYTGTQLFNVASDASVLGRKVSLFVKIESNTNKAAVIGSAIISDDNKVITDYSSDSIKDVADDNNLDFTSNTKIAYNYAAQTALTAADADNKTKTGVDTGIEKILIDTDNDGDLDYVLVNTVQLGKVTKYATTGDGAINVSLKSGNGIYSVDKKDDVIGFDDVKKDDMVLVSFIGGKLNVAKAETVTGTIEAYKNNKGNTKTTTLTVDGTDYTVSNAPTYSTSDFFAAKDLFVSDDTAMDTEATFYLDAQGYIIASGEVTDAAYDYAYVINKGQNNLDDRVKVALSDGTTGTYVLNSTSGVKYENVNVGDLYAYTLNSDKNKIKFTKPYDVTTGSAYVNKLVTFEKGKSTVKVDGKDPFYTNNSTVFFYKNGNDVNIYVGRDKAPTVDNTQPIDVKIATNRAGTAVAVLFDGVAVQASVGDHLFVYDLGKSYSDYRIAKVILNGKETVEEIKVDNGSSPARDTLYTYTVNSDGYYELTTVGGKAYYGYGEVMHYNSGSLVLTNFNGTTNSKNEYLVDEKTVVIDNDGDPSTPDVSFKGNIGVGDSIQVLADDDTAKMIVITKYADSDSSSGNVPKDMKVSVNDGEGEISVFNPAKSGTNAVVNGVVAELEKLGYENITYTKTNKTVIGNKIIDVQAKKNGTTYNFEVYNAARVDVNGTEAVAYLHDGNTTVNVTSKTANTKMIVGSVADALTLTTGDNKKATYTFDSDDADEYGVITLNDAAVVNTNSLTVKAGSDAVRDTYLVAVGTTLTVTGTAVDGQVIRATANGKTVDGSAATSDVAATLKYTMTQYDVTFTQVAAPKTVTVSLDGDKIPGGVYTAKNEKDKFEVALSATKGQTGDKITVTVTAKNTVSEDITLTLTGPTFTTSAALKFKQSDPAGTKSAADFTLANDSVKVSASDSTTAPAPTHLLTLPANVSATWSAGIGYGAGKIEAGMSGQAPEGATITLAGSAVVSTSYLKVGSSYVKDGSADFTMPANAVTVDATKYHKVTMAAASVDTSAVTPALKSGTIAAALDSTTMWVAEGNNVTVTFSLSGMSAAAGAQIKAALDDITGATSTKFPHSTAAEIIASSATNTLTESSDVVTIGATAAADVELAYTLS